MKVKRTDEQQAPPAGSEPSRSAAAAAAAPLGTGGLTQSDHDMIKSFLSTAGFPFPLSPGTTVSDLTSLAPPSPGLLLPPQHLPSPPPIPDIRLEPLQLTGLTHDRLILEHSQIISHDAKNRAKGIPDQLLINIPHEQQWSDALYKVSVRKQSADTKLQEEHHEVLKVVQQSSEDRLEARQVQPDYLVQLHHRDAKEQLSYFFRSSLNAEELSLEEKKSEGLPHLPSDDSLTQLQTADSLRHLPSNDSLRHLPSNDSLRQLPSNDSLRQLPSNDNLRHLPSNDNLRQPSSNDSLRQPSSNDSLRQLPSNDSLRQIRQNKQFKKKDKKRRRKVKKLQAERKAEGFEKATQLEESAQQVQKRLVTGCECDSKCLEGLDAEKVYRHRCNIAELSKTEHDMYLMGMTMATMADPRSTTKHKERQRNRIKYIFQGREVCQDAFLYLENVTIYQLKSIRKHVTNNGITPRIHKNKGKRPHNVFELDHYQLAHRFVEDQLEDEGGKKKKGLPGDVTCMKLHKAYKDYFGNMCEAGAGVKLMAYSTFRNFVHQRFPLLKFSGREKEAAVPAHEALQLQDPATLQLQEPLQLPEAGALQLQDTLLTTADQVILTGELKL